MKSFFNKLKLLALLSVVGGFASSGLLVLALKWVPVYSTPLIYLRAFEYSQQGKKLPSRKEWMPLEKISIHLQRAVIASEDPKFLEHHGFDYEAIARAFKLNQRRKHKIVASTITQQTAKNVFLYPSRTYFRKGLEAYFTLLIEAIWDKRRILEVYLNVVELGPGIYGSEAAARYYWNKSADQITPREANLFAAILPNPRHLNPKMPSKQVIKRCHFIQRNLRILGTSYFNPLGLSASL